MRNLAGRTAFITGAGGGLGAGIARALASEGVSLALADIQSELLEQRLEEFRRLGVNCKTYCLDVSDRQSMYAVADQIERDLGPVHICVNNAAVGYVGAPADQVPDEDYDWVLSVNVRGVINGVRAFVPRMRLHGEGGHVVNVASVDGLLPEPALNHAPYCASKAAVILFSEALRNDLASQGIGVSVVCPGLVRSALPDSSRLRPDQFGGPYLRPGADAFKGEMQRSGMPPEIAGRIIVEGIRDDQLYVFTHAGWRDRVRNHQRSVLAAFEWADEAGRRAGLEDPSQWR